MSAHVTIETASRAEAELIAGSLPSDATAGSSRGIGVIRLGRQSDRKIAETMDAVAEAVAKHRLTWARVRYDDEERFFRGDKERVARDEKPRQPPSQRAQSRSPHRSLVDLVADLTRDWPSTTTDRPNGKT